MKNTSNQKTIQKLFSITPKHMEVISHIMKDRGVISESDVIRQALMGYHDKLYPNYIFQLSPAGEEKKRKRDKAVAYEETDDEQFATGLKAKVVANTEGNRFVLMHQIANMIMAIPLSGFKEWAKTHKSDIELHKEKIERVPLEPMLQSTYMKELLKTGYKIEL